MPIPVSVIIVTKNEAQRIASCLSALKDFDDVWVVDSVSRDGTLRVASSLGARGVSYEWNGIYPKKRQWCLDTLSLKYDWVFFVDADEIIPADLVHEIDEVVRSNPLDAGFFVVGRYRLRGQVLRYGFPNAKIALFHRGRMEFPVVDDLDIPGMGEIEGHYQPVLKSGCSDGRIGTLRQVMIHDALDDARAWVFRHEKYARWEAGMNKRGAWPVDPVPWRQKAKVFLRSSLLRAELMFVAGYVLKLGFLDGWAGFYMARMKYWYYRMIGKLAKSL